MSKKGKKKNRGVWVIEHSTLVEGQRYGYTEILAVVKSKKKARKYIKMHFPDIDWFYDDDTFMDGGALTSPGEISTVTAYLMDVL